MSVRPNLKLLDNTSEFSRFTSCQRITIAILVCSTVGLVFSDTEDGYPFKRLDESVLDAPPVEALLEIPEDRFFPYQYVEAGYFPTYVGDAEFVGYEAIDNFTGADKKKAISLERYGSVGYGKSLNQFIYGTSWFNFLKGKSLALIVNDLKKQGYNPKQSRSVEEGIFSLMHIKLETPGHKSSYPSKATLFIKLLDHDIDFHDHDIVLETALPLVSGSNGDYYLADPIKAMKTMRNMGLEAHTIVGDTYVSGKGRELKLVRIAGIDDEVKVKNVPRIEGVVMTHQIYIGSFQVTSGWEWFGRPDGLFQSQQKGFIQ